MFSNISMITLLILIETNFTFGENCDCHQLRIENRLLRDLVLSQKIPVPELQSSVTTDDVIEDVTDVVTAVISDTTTEIVTSFTTIVTSPVVTEVPIWWQNRYN